MQLGVKMYRHYMDKNIRLILAGTLGWIVIATIMTGCSSKPTYEQKRSDVITYLQAFNGIEDSFDSASSQIVYPQSLNTTVDLVALNAAITELLPALDGAISRLKELKPSSLEISTSAHLQQVRSFYQSQRLLVRELQDAVTSGDLAVIVLKANELADTNASASSLNRATEQLMLQYNISDSEVGYSFRGK
jgi:hypothetical protein